MNIFRKKLKIIRNKENRTKDFSSIYPNLKTIIFKEIFNTKMQFYNENKVNCITFFDNIKIMIDKEYNLSNIIIKDNELKIEYKNDYESILKVFEITNNNILYRCENKIITKVKNKWICNNRLTIPKSDGIYNLEIDGENLSIFEELDLRNVKNINGIKFKNCNSLKKIIISDPSKQTISMNFFDSSLNNILNINKITLVIENESIVNSFGNKKIELEFNKYNLKELLSIETSKKEYIIKYGEHNNIKNNSYIYLRIKPDLRIFNCDNDHEILITQNTFNIDKHISNKTNKTNYNEHLKKHHFIDIKDHEKLLEKNNRKLVKKKKYEK